VNTISAHRSLHPGLRALAGPDHVKDLVAAFSAQFEQALLARGFAAGWETYEIDRSYNLFDYPLLLTHSTLNYFNHVLHDFEVCVVKYKCCGQHNYSGLEFLK